MKKAPKCKKQDCNEPKMKRPGNTNLHFPFCQDHQIEANLSKVRADMVKDKQGLEKMRKTTSKRKKTAKQVAQDRADEWFSKHIRLKYSYEVSGVIKCKCYTCGKEHNILEVENGHFQSRRHKLTRYHLNNARPQDPYCNKYLHGNVEVFESNLILEVGKEEVENVKELARQTGEDTEMFYREMSDKYRTLFNSELKRLDIKNPWK